MARNTMERQATYDRAEVREVKINIVRLIGCAAMLISMAVRADEPLADPSEVDLHVAYCLGVDEAKLIMQRAAMQNENPELRNTYTRSARDTQSHLDRLNQYLDQRLPLLKAADMDAASKQGFSEAKVTESDEKLRACFRNCVTPPVYRLDLPIESRKNIMLKCSAGCDKNVPKMLTCTDLSWIP
jgi:hypothetical protein